MFSLHPVHIIIALSVLLAIALVKAGLVPLRRAARKAAPAKPAHDQGQRRNHIAVMERLAAQRDAWELEREIERLRDR